VNPEYPPKARNQHVQGVVMMDATIGREGCVIEVPVTSGDPVLAEAAVRAAKKWKYQSYLIDGSPVEVEAQDPDEFQPRLLMNRVLLSFNMAGWGFAAFGWLRVFSSPW
jgi:TonB family protein